MFLERRIVIALQGLNEEKRYPKAEDLVQSLGQKWWPKLNYLGREGFEKRARIALNDIIGPDPSRHFIDYHEDPYGIYPRESLAVTARGRKFMKGPGFIEMILDEYPNILKICLAMGAGISLVPFAKKLPHWAGILLGNLR